MGRGLEGLVISLQTSVTGMIKGVKNLIMNY